MKKYKMIQRRTGRYLFIKVLPALLLALVLTVIPLFASAPVQIFAVDITPTPFLDPATAEAGIKGFIQTRLEVMSPTIVFTVSGLEACKLFLVTDENHDIVQPLSLTSFCQDIFEEQVDNMQANNYNAYYRLAMMVDWGIGINSSITTLGNTITNIELNITYTINWRDGARSSEALNGRNAVIAHAQAFLASGGYPSAGSNDQKLRAINNYICETFQYDYRLFVPAEAGEAIYSAYQMISDTGAIGGYPRGVCQAYAMYGYIMLKAAGYDAITISGTAGGGGHAWNMVKVGSRWYHIDFTWNDPISSNNALPYVKRQNGAGTVSENYFMRSDTEMRINHDWDLVTDNGHVYPVATYKWAENDPIVDITQPNPEPTPTNIPSPTHAAIPTVTHAPSSSSNASSSGNIASSSGSISSSSDSISPSSDVSLISEPVSTVSDSGSQNIVFSTQEIVSGNSTDTIGAQPTVEDEKTVTITGKLLDYLGKPMSGIRILLYNTGRTSTTDKDGNYRFIDVKVGSYKIFIINSAGDETAELPIVISFGEQTLVSDGSVQVKGGSLQMDLTLSGEVLLIKSVFSPRFVFTKEVIVYIVMIVMILLAITLFVIFKRDRTRVDVNMD